MPWAKFWKPFTMSCVGTRNAPILALALTHLIREISSSEAGVEVLRCPRKMNKHTRILCAVYRDLQAIQSIRNNREGWLNVPAQRGYALEQRTVAAYNAVRKAGANHRLFNKHTEKCRHALRWDPHAPVVALPAFLLSTFLCKTTIGMHLGRICAPCSQQTNILGAACSLASEEKIHAANVDTISRTAVSK